MYFSRIYFKLTINIFTLNGIIKHQYVISLDFQIITIIYNKQAIQNVTIHFTIHQPILKNSLPSKENFFPIAK